jgi:hypothetical protein
VGGRAARARDAAAAGADDEVVEVPAYGCVRLRGDGVSIAGVPKLRTQEQCVSDIVVTAAARRSDWPPRSDATGRRARAAAASMKLAVINCMDGVLLCPIAACSLARLKAYRAGFADLSGTVLDSEVRRCFAPVRLKTRHSAGLGRDQAQLLRTIDATMEVARSPTTPMAIPQTAQVAPPGARDAADGFSQISTRRAS